MEKKKNSKEKIRLHIRNKHRISYDFKQLTESCPELSQFVKLNKYDNESIDFSNPIAVKALNKALLLHHYNITFWEIPPNYLCPPIPGRADYIHNVADVLCCSNYGNIPTGSKVKCLDIGVGANCIYPIIGVNEYGWSFIGSDIDPVSVESANNIIKHNPSLNGKIEIRLQKNSWDYFYGALREEEMIDLSICNPPFHISLEAALAGTIRKLKNLNKKKAVAPTLNFGGQGSELWCKGGEGKFVQDMVFESRKFGERCYWFSSLISKQTNLKGVYSALKKSKAVEVKTIPMGQGNKSSRIVAWTFLQSEQQMSWKNARWK